jgi:acyl-CoA reductase-like NAD-dependent aldehyde dehydrogenase
MAIPSLCSGNSVLLRLPNSTPMVGQALDEIFRTCDLSGKIQVVWSDFSAETTEFILS